MSDDDINITMPPSRRQPMEKVSHTHTTVMLPIGAVSLPRIANAIQTLSRVIGT